MLKTKPSQRYKYYKVYLPSLRSASVLTLSISSAMLSDTSLCKKERKKDSIVRTSKNLNVDQNCIFEENKSSDHQISERRSVDQNCIGTHLPSRERGGLGPKMIPPCTQFWSTLKVFENAVLVQFEQL